MDASWFFDGCGRSSAEIAHFVSRTAISLASRLNYSSWEVPPSLEGRSEDPAECREILWEMHLARKRWQRKSIPGASWKQEWAVVYQVKMHRVLRLKNLKCTVFYSLSLSLFQYLDSTRFVQFYGEMQVPQRGLDKRIAGKKLVEYRGESKRF